MGWKGGGAVGWGIHVSMVASFSLKSMINVYLRVDFLLILSAAIFSRQGITTVGRAPRRFHVKFVATARACRRKSPYSYGLSLRMGSRSYSLCCP